jgi:general stress protein 26
MNEFAVNSPSGVFGGGLGMSGEELEQFLSRPRVAAFSWHTSTGDIHSSPMWFTHRDGVFLLHTGHPSPKTTALLTDDRAALLIQDDRPPYRYLSVRGRVRLRREPEVALQLYREQAYAYYGSLTGRLYLRRVLPTFEGSEHVILELRPTTLVALNASAALHPLLWFALQVARAIGL